MNDAIPPWAAALTEKVDELRVRSVELDQSIRGDGKQPGLVGRIVTVEQAQERTKRWGQTAVGAAVAAIVGAVVAWFRGHGAGTN